MSIEDILKQNTLLGILVVIGLCVFLWSRPHGYVRCVAFALSATLMTCILVFWAQVFDADEIWANLWLLVMAALYLGTALGPIDKIIPG